MKKLLLFLLLNSCFLILNTKPVFASLEGITPTPEIINPQSSVFCTDFDIYYNRTDSSTEELTPVPTSALRSAAAANSEADAQLKMDNESIPDYSNMQENFSSALEKIMPQDLKEMLSIDSFALQTKAKHIVLSKDSNGQLVPPNKDTKFAETDINHPEWWTVLIGQTKMLCGVFGTCKAPKSPVIKIQPAVSKINNSNYRSICRPGEQPVAEPVNLAHRPDFKAPMTVSSVVTTVWNAVKKLWERITNTTKTVELADKTRGQLAGGSTVRQQANFLASFLPADFIKGNSPLAGNASFNAKIEGNDATLQNGDTDKVKFQNQGVVRLERCMSLCSIYPSDFDIHTIDPLCPSCDLNQYQQGASGMDDPYLDMSLCRKQGDGSCDYCWPIGENGIGKSCDGDPVCEGGKCCPMQYRQAKDYTSNGCPVPYGAADCTDSSICRKMTFEKNPDGGFGACQYSNQEVCVRTDREDVDSCGAVCNWACCAYQYGDY